jgi:hypothetical protein
VTNSDPAICPVRAISRLRSLRDRSGGRRQVGEDASEFGTHSFRSGGTTEAFNRGASAAEIKAQGIWKSDSSKDLYIREHEKSRAKLASSQQEFCEKYREYRKISETFWCNLVFSIFQIHN